jgi:phage-related protein
MHRISRSKIVSSSFRPYSSYIKNIRNGVSSVASGASYAASGVNYVASGAAHGVSHVANGVGNVASGAVDGVVNTTTGVVNTTTNAMHVLQDLSDSALTMLIEKGCDQGVKALEISLNKLSNNNPDANVTVTVDVVGLMQITMSSHKNREHV